MDFPNLETEGFQETSPKTEEYNFIAWAAGTQDLCWWPDPFGIGYWPVEDAREETLPAFFRAFESLGYVTCDSGDLEMGYEKVAIFGLNGNPTHAARQLANGQWSSKLGDGIDIAHTLAGIEGPLYGQVAGYLKRATTPAKSAQLHGRAELPDGANGQR